MNPHPRHQSLLFTPRPPWGTRLTGRTFHNHMRASEDSRELPEEEKDGAIQGKIEISGGNQGKPESYFGVQLNSNPHGHETANYKDPLWEGREKLNDQRKEAQVQKKQQQPQKEMNNYVNTALSAADDGAAFLKKIQGQARPSR